MMFTPSQSPLKSASIKTQGPGQAKEVISLLHFLGLFSRRLGWFMVHGLLPAHSLTWTWGVGGHQLSYNIH